MDDHNLYQFLFETASEGMILLREGQCVHVNASALQMLAVEKEACLGKLFTDFMPVYQPDGRESAAVFLERETDALAGHPQTFEFVLHSATDTAVIVRLNLQAVEMDGTQFLRISLQDIRREHLQAEALASAETEWQERRRRQVQLVTQVNQAIATAGSLDELYRRVVTQIKEHFHYYHVQLLRYDAGLDAAVLVAGYGDIGAQMMAQEHQMRVGEGLIGLAAARGESVLRSDVTDDPHWRANSLLPETAGELVVPIKLGDTVLALLDVQSDIPGLLDTDDQIILEEVCGQIAIAMESTILRQEMETRLRELGTLQQLTTLDGWRDFSARMSQPVTGYQFQQGALEPLPPDSDAPSEANTVTMPMDIHGARIGQVGIFDDPDHPLTPEEESLLADITTQITEALERARLFEQTRRQSAELRASLFETETLYRASRAIGSAAGTEDIALGAAQIAVSLRMAQCDITLFTATDNDGTPTHGDVYTVRVEKNELVLQPVMFNMALWDTETARQTTENPQIIVIYRDAEDEDEAMPVAARGYLRGLNLRGGALLGLQARGKPLGMLSYFSREPLAGLVENHIRQMRTIADQVVISLENQRLLVDAQARATRERLSREIGAKLTSSVDVNIILKTAARELSQALKTTHGLIRLGAPPENDSGTETIDLRLPETWQTLIHAAEPQLYRRAGNMFASPGDVWRQEMRDAMARRSPAMVDGGASARVKSALVVPIVLRGQLLGAVEVYDETETRHWTEDDIALMLNVAGQTALALDNARLFTEAQQALGTLAEQARRPALLNEMNQVLSRIDSEPRVLEISVGHIKNILRAELVQIYLLNRTTDHLELMAYATDTVTDFSAAMATENTMLGSVVIQNRQHTSDSEGVYVAVISRTEDSSWADVQQCRQQRGINSMMIAPLMVGTQVVGVLSVGAQKAGTYTADDKTFFIQVATLLSATIENRRLFKQTQQALANTERLYDVSQSLNAADNLQDVLSVVLGAFPIPDINRALLLTLKRDLLTRTETLTVIANWHNGTGTPPTEVGKQFMQPLDDPLSTLVSTEPRFVADAHTDNTLDAPTAAWLKMQKTRALAVFPLEVGQRYVGSLVLQGETPHSFRADEIQPYNSIILQVATTVENQRLLAETRAALAEVEATQRRYTLQSWEAYHQTHPKLAYQKISDPEIDVPPVPESDIAIAVTEKSPVVRAEPTEKTPTAEVILPLLWRGEVTGVLGVQAKPGEHRDWQPEEIALLRAIAGEFAQVADSLRLLDETQRRAAREARINAINEKIQSAQSIEEALRIAVKEVGRSLHAPQTSVQLSVEAED